MQNEQPPRQRMNGPFPIRHPVCSRQCDNIQSSRHLLGTYPATTVLTPSNEQLDWKTISTSGDRTLTLSLPLGSPKMILGGLFPKSIRRASATLLWGDGSSDEPYASPKSSTRRPQITQHLDIGHSQSGSSRLGVRDSRADSWVQG